IEFSISERRAGQWQPKRTLSEKMFFGSYAPMDLPGSLQFDLRAFQDPAENLQIQLYWGRGLIGTGILESPDDPLRITQWYYYVPASADVDPTQEPSLPLVAIDHAVAITMWRQLPNGFTYLGQDLVSSAAPGAGGTTVPLNVLCATGKGPLVNVTLLGAVERPHLILPQQEPVFDSADPFFNSDAARVFFVQPHYYTVSSAPVELDTLTYIPQWTTQYAFSPFYHPFARTFLRE